MAIFNEKKILIKCKNLILKNNIKVLIKSNFTGNKFQQFLKH